MKGGLGNCCRFATLVGVHQGAHICLDKSSALKQNYGTSYRKDGEVEVVPGVDLIAYKKYMWALQHKCIIEIKKRQL